MQNISIKLAAEQIGTILGLPITNSILMGWIIMALLIILSVIVRKRLSLVPGRLQNAFEMSIEYIYNHVEETLGSPKLARRYFPLIATIFIFVLFINMFEFFPTIESLHISHAGGSIPLLRTTTTDLNMTLGLAIISFLTVELSGIFTLGFLKYGSKFVNFKGGLIGLLVGLVEVIGNISRLISPSFRLFGAIFAGDILVLIVGAFVPLLLPVPLMAFEMFVGLLQAGVFAILTLAFIKIAIEEPHGSHGSKRGHGEELREEMENIEGGVMA